MLVNLRIELRKLAWKPRTWIGPAAALCLTVLALISLKYGHEFDRMQERMMQDFITAGSIVNASLLTRFMLFEPVVFMLLPLFTCLVFGDLMASEAADGTLRTILCRPITRMRVALSKYIVGLIYAMALTLGMGLLAYALGTAFLGRGSLVTLYDGIWVLPERAALIRLAQVYLLVAVGMVAVGSMSYAISTFLSNSNGAIAGAMGIVVGSGIVGQIEYFARIKPYLLTTYLQVGGFLTGELDTGLYMKSMEVMLIYSAVSLIVGLAVFQRRDVLT